MACCRAPALQVCASLVAGGASLVDGGMILGGWWCIHGGWWRLPGGWWCILASSAAYCSRAPRQGHAPAPQCGGALP